MKIVQILPVFAKGDAIGNETAELDRVLREEGYDAAICAENLRPPLTRRDAYDPDILKTLKREDVAVLHLSTSSKVNILFSELKCKKAIIYHNVTPAEFFEPFNIQLAEICKEGIRQVRKIRNCADVVIADSEYNKQDLIKLGYTVPIEVMPLLIPFEDYDGEYDTQFFEKLNDGKKNILYTGRIAPNKGIEDMIAAFACYERYYDLPARLIISGLYEEKDRYYQALKKYCKALQTQNVLFTGHISFQKILACYRAADLYLCMSHHEGFCVPLTEAMHFKIPILAYESTAVAETLGGSGFLLKERNFRDAAGAMHRLLTDDSLRQLLIKNEEERLKRFDHEAIKAAFLEIIRKLIA